MNPPNILLLFTDQQRHDTISALGNPIIRTPALDRLATEGTAFLRCYSPSPVCMPARAAMLTGLPPHVTGCVDNVAFPERAASIMQLLAARGYQTHGVGKMHFGGDWKRLWGFESRDTSEELQPDSDFPRYLNVHGFAHVLEPHGLRSEYYYLPQPSQLPSHLHESSWVADRSIDFLQRRDRRRPFFLFSSFVKPHPPFESPAPWHRLYRSDEMPPPHVPGDSSDTWTRSNIVQNRYKYQDQLGANLRQLGTLKAAYYSAISFVDFNIGRILAALGPEIDNTLIVFASDHGELLGDYGCFGKRSMHEASARVPCLVRYPAAFPAGKRILTATSLIDFFPTFAEAAGAPGTRPHPDGRSLFEVVREPSRKRVVQSQFQRGWMGHYMATDGRWKYIYSAPDRKELLFEVTGAGREGRNRARDPRGRDRLNALQDVMRVRFARDGYRDAFAGAGWRKHRVRPFPRDPNYGLLYQDEAGLQSRIDQLGPAYRRTVTKPEADGYRIVLDHMAGSPARSKNAKR